MFLVELSFTAHSAMQSHPSYLVGPFKIIEVDVSSMLQDVLAKGECTHLSPRQRDVAALAYVKV